MLITRLKWIKCSSRQELLPLVFIVLNWLLALAYNCLLNDHYKYRFFKSTDKLFMDKYDRNYESSQRAYGHMTEWLRANNITGRRLFNHNHLKKPLNDAFCVGILSDERDSTRVNYPFQTVVALLTRIRLKHERQVFIDVLDVDTHSTGRRDLLNLTDLVNIVDLRIVDNGGHNVLYKLYPKLKEARDYANAMNYYARSRRECAHVLLLEDDSLPCVDWYEKIVESLARIGTDQNLLCLKLFTAFRFYDWIMHPPTVLKIVCCMVGWFVVSTWVVLRRQPKKRPLMMLLFGLNAALLVVWLQSTSVDPLGYGLKRFSLGFNTVAMVYPSGRLALASDYINNHLDNFLSGSLNNFQPKDILLKQLKSNMRLGEYIVEPSVFQHVGFQSSLKNGHLNLKGIAQIQNRPFQSYSFEKEYSTPPVSFDPVFWNS